MRRILGILVALAVLGAGVFWLLTRPETVDPARFAGLSGDAARGEAVFWAGGCASCHAAPGARDDDRLVLAGGYRMDSPFGVFIAPNISPSGAGIGGWDVLDLANAVQKGVAPDGRHYYPAFPYGSYSRMRDQDVVDLKAFMDTLPASDQANLPHDLAFPLTIRRGIGLWKLLHLNEDWVLTEAGSPEIEHGRYLVEALGHCAECHTPRGLTGGLDHARWMQGAPNPSGQGNIPPISPGQMGWTATDIAFYMETGLTPDFDSVGGPMVSVVDNFSRLTPEDRGAVAAYLMALP